jgi:hypothetical protein
MLSQVTQRLAHALRHVSAPSLAGRDLPDRLRSVSVGLVGLVAAAGLSLVALAYNAGIPEALWSPLPAIPRAHVGEARSFAPHTHAGRSSTTRSGGGSSTIGSHGGAASGPAPTASGQNAGPGSRHSSSQAHGAPGGVTPGSHGTVPSHPSGHGPAGTPAAGSPPATAAPPAKEPAAEAPAPAPPPVAPPAEEAPVPEASGPDKGKGKAKGHEKPSHSEAPPPIEEPAEDSTASHGKGKEK